MIFGQHYLIRTISELSVAVANCSITWMLKGHIKPITFYR